MLGTVHPPNLSLLKESKLGFLSSALPVGSQKRGKLLTSGQFYYPLNMYFHEGLVEYTPIFFPYFFNSLIIAFKN